MAKTCGSKHTAFSSSRRHLQMPVLHSQLFHFWHISGIISSTGLHGWGSSLMDSPHNLNCLVQYFIWYSPNTANNHSLTTLGPFPFFIMDQHPELTKSMLTCGYADLYCSTSQVTNGLRWNYTYIMQTPVKTGYIYSGPHIMLNIFHSSITTNLIIA
jgi:hypothetical protein